MPHFWIIVYGLTENAVTEKKPPIDEGEWDSDKTPKRGDKISFHGKSCTVVKVDPPPPFDGTIECTRP